MRYFWHALVSIIALALIVFLFFIFSVRSDHQITFTDERTNITAPTVSVADPITGPDDAAVTLVLFGDYQCEACTEAEESVTAVANDYPNDVRVIWKDMPNTESHPEALNAAVAARCAGKQDQFFAYNAYLFANQSSLGEELYTSIAEQLGLKTRAFASCLANQDTLPLVQKSFEEALALRVTVTPTLYINGERYAGSMSESDIRSTVRSLISAR